MAGSASAHGTDQGNCVLTWVNWDRLGVNRHWDWVWLGSRGVVWGRLGVVWLWGVSDPLVLDVGDVSVLVVGVVGDDLGAAVGKGNPVLAGDDAVVILDLLLVEEGARVLVLHAVLVGEGLRKYCNVMVCVKRI